MTYQPTEDEQDFLDDAAEVADAYSVDVIWQAKDTLGRVTHHSDMVLTGRQAEAMFRGLASSAALPEKGDRAERLARQLRMLAQTNRVPKDLAQTEREFLVEWRIGPEEAISPEIAARDLWRSVFGRSSLQPGPDEACVFTVTDVATGQAVDIDLSEPQFADLFD